MEIFCIEKFQIIHRDISPSWRWSCVENFFQRVRCGKVAHGWKAIESTVMSLMKSWNHKRILGKGGKYEESTGFNYTDIHKYIGMPLCIYILYTVVGQFLFQMVAWLSQATSLPSVIDLPTSKSSLFKLCIKPEKKDSKRGPGWSPVSDIHKHMAFVTTVWFFIGL